MTSPTATLVKGKTSEQEGEQQTVKKTAAKKKVVTKKKTTIKKGPQITDLIAEAAKAVENVTKEQAVEQIHTLLNEEGRSDFVIGGYLAKVQENGWWEEYETFRLWVEGEVGIHYKKALRLISIYTGLVESGVSWESVKDVQWTKLKEFAHLLSEKNVAEWVQRAKDMTTLQLIEYIKQLEKGESSSTSGGTPQVTTMTFKVHPDQKETIRLAVDKAKAEHSTEYDAVALEFICMTYLEGKLGKPKGGKQLSIKEQMQKSNVEDVLEVFGEVFPDVTITAEL